VGGNKAFFQSRRIREDEKLHVTRLPRGRREKDEKKKKDEAQAYRGGEK